RGPLLAWRRAARAHVADEFFRREAGGEQEALAHGDAQLQQEAALRLVLDAFGHQPQAEAARDAGDRLADRHVRLVVGYPGHEQLAELQSLDGQATQVIERA